MRFLPVLVLALACRALSHAASPQEAKVPGREAQATSSESVQTEKVEGSQASQSPVQALSGEAGYMDPAQVRAVLRKFALLEFRINDLLTTVQPQRWKLSEASRSSFNQRLDGLRAALRELGESRAQLDRRVDNAHLCYQTHRAVLAVLPHLEAVGQSVSKNENASLGAQYTQARNQLADLAQPLGRYLECLLRNQDQIASALENNLANCQNTLGYALRPTVAPARLMPNAPSIRPERRRSQRARQVVGQAPAQKILTPKPQKSPASAPGTKRPEPRPPAGMKSGQPSKPARRHTAQPSASAKKPATPPAQKPVHKKK